MTVSETLGFINSNAEALVMMVGSAGFLGWHLYSLYFEIFGSHEQRETKRIRFYNGESHPTDEQYNSSIEIKNHKVRLFLMYPLLIASFIGMFALAVTSIDFR